MKRKQQEHCEAVQWLASFPEMAPGNLSKATYNIYFDVNVFWNELLKLWTISLDGETEECYFDTKNWNYTLHNVLVTRDTTGNTCRKQMIRHTDCIETSETSISNVQQMAVLKISRTQFHNNQYPEIHVTKDKVAVHAEFTYTVLCITASNEA